MAVVLPDADSLFATNISLRMAVNFRVGTDPCKGVAIIVRWERDVDEHAEAMSEIRELALEKAARILGGGATRADEPAEQYAIIVDFEIQTSRERALVIVVERTTREPSFETAAVASEFGLTQREAEVALSLANRRSSSEIARALGISPHTARRHAERVLDKLGIRSRREVADVLRRRRVVRG